MKPNNKLSVNMVVLILTIEIVFAGWFLLYVSSLTYAQTPTPHSSSSSSSEDVKKKTTTSGGTLDVLLEPSPNPIKNAQDTKFKVTFLQKGTDTVQVHIDYDFIILKDNSTEVFRASKQTGQPLLHTAEGVVTIPFTFQDAGNYIIKVPVMGINFIPISTEYSEFPIKVVKG
jgi:hypothetical protein